MQKRNPTMTSVEAAALILSEGKTTDPEQANLYAEGRILDPEALERAYYRRALGFDFTITQDDEAHKWIVRDTEFDIVVTAALSDTDEKLNAARLAKACMKLKRLHEEADES